MPEFLYYDGIEIKPGAIFCVDLYVAPGDEYGFYCKGSPNREVFICQHHSFLDPNRSQWFDLISPLEILALQAD